jgi:hypothetical protein
MKKETEKTTINGSLSDVSPCSALDLLRIRALVADKEMLVSRANNDLAVGGYWLGDYEGWAREIQGEIDAILKQNAEVSHTK